MLQDTKYMNRRTFLGTSTAVLGSAAAGSSLLAASTLAGGERLEDAAGHVLCPV